MPEYTQEYAAWKSLNDRYHAGVDKLLAEFYTQHPKPTEAHLLVEHDRLRIRSELYDKFLAGVLDGNGTALSDEDRERLRSLLPAYQAEMRALIDFLKNKFFETGPDH